MVMDQIGQNDEPEFERNYGSPDSEIWREEEELYLEMTGSGQTDSLNERDSVDADTSVEPEPEASQDQ